VNRFPRQITGGLSRLGRSAGVGVAPFSPADVPGALLWYDLSDVSTLYRDPTLSTPVTADGDVIGGIVDKFGNNHNALKDGATATLPIYKVNSKNGLSTAFFDGTDDYLINTSIGIQAQPNTIFAVAAAVTTGADRYVYDTRTSGRQALVMNATSYLFADASLNFTNTSRQLYSLYTAHFNTTASSIRKNGQQLAAGNVGAGIPRDMTIGKLQFALAAFFGGNLAELVYYNTTLSDANRDAVEAYLNSKWEIY